MRDFCVDCGNTIDSCTCELYLASKPKNLKECILVNKEYYKRLIAENEKLKVENHILTNFSGLSIDKGMKLEAENKQLKEMFEKNNSQSLLAQTMFAISEDYEKLKQEYAEQMQIMVDEEKNNLEHIKRLEEALRKCNPWILSTEQCIFCGAKLNHADDCEYIQLTKEDEP